METLDFIVNGGETRRYHTWPVLRHQTVAAHSCHVALIAAWLADKANVKPTAALLMAALTHDLAEHKWGDIPAPAKRALPGFKEKFDALENGTLASHGYEWEAELSRVERRWLKFADNADGCFYCVRERAMGNKLITEVHGNFRSYLEQMVPFSDAEMMLVSYIDSRWKEASV